MTSIFGTRWVNWLCWPLLCGVLAGCPPKGDQRPQRHVEAVQLPPQPVSVIQVPIELPTAQLQRLVERALPQPLWQAQTKKFTLRLAPQKAKADQNWLQRKATPLLHWVDKTIDASAQLAYTVALDHWTLHAEGQRVEAAFVLDLDGRVELDNALNWQGQRHGFRQTLSCPTQVRLSLKGDLDLTDDARLAIRLDAENGGHLQVLRLCSNRQLRALDLPELLRPTLEPLQKELVRLLNQALTQQLQRLLDRADTREQLRFQQHIDAAARYLAQAYPIRDSIWFLPNAEQIAVSPPQGIGHGAQNRIRLAVGIVARPSLVLQRSAPHAPQPESGKLVLLPYRPQTTVHLRGKWSLQHAARQVQHYLSAYVRETYASYGYDIGRVDIYPQGTQAVVAIELLKRANGKRKAWLYVKGTPQYSTETREVYLSDLHFAAESKDLLLHLAKWWKQAELLRRLEANTRWDAAPYFEQAQAQLRHWRVALQGGVLEGRFTDLSVQQVWISAQYFEVAVQARGQVRAELDWEQWSGLGQLRR